MSRPETPTRETPRGRLFLVIVLLGALLLAFRIVQPYLNPILLGVILGSMVHPVFRWHRRWLKGRDNLAALLTCLLVAVLILGPLALMGTALVNQGIHSVQAIQEWVESGKLAEELQKPWVRSTRERIDQVLPLIDLDSVDIQGPILSVSRGLGQLLFSRGGAILSGTGSLLLKFFLMLFVLFYVLRDGEELLTHLLHLSPLRRSHEEKLIERIRVVSKSALLGTFLTAGAQGLAGGIGLWIAGIPALFWGTMMAVASLIPVVGTSLIWIPAALYLLISGRWGMAIFLSVWCAAGVGSIDNFLRPFLMGGKARMSTLMIFFAILGGLQLFGLMGLIYGPLVFGLCAVLLYLYELEFQEYLVRQDNR